MKTTQIILITPLLFVAACVAAPNSSYRAESGALDEELFLEASWVSSNFEQSTAQGDCALFVFVSSKEKVDQDFSAYLETELGHLRRFPVIPMNAGSTGRNAYDQLKRMGQVDFPDGTRRQPSRALVLEFKADKRVKEYTPNNTPYLNKSALKIFEYWYEGLLTVSEIGPGGQSSLIYSDRTFRSKSSWNRQITNLNLQRRKGHDETDPEHKARAYREARNSVLFKISKEVYSRLGISGAIDVGTKSGKHVLLSTGIGNSNGVQPKQPMFIYFVKGNLEIPLAKAIVQSVTNLGSTMRVIEWTSGDDRASGLADDPEGFVENHMGALYARTEGLREPEEWSERMMAIERLVGKRVEDNQWGKLDPKIQALVNSR